MRPRRIIVVVGPRTARSAPRAPRGAARRSGTRGPAPRTRARPRASARARRSRRRARARPPAAAGERLANERVLARGQQERQRRRALAQVGAGDLAGLDRLARRSRGCRRRSGMRCRGRARTRPARSPPPPSRHAASNSFPVFSAQRSRYASTRRVRVVRLRAAASPRRARAQSAASARTSTAAGSPVVGELGERAREEIVAGRARGGAPPWRSTRRHGRAGTRRGRSGRRARASPCARARPRRRLRAAARPVRRAEEDEQRPQPLAAGRERLACRPSATRPGCASTAARQPRLEPRRGRRRARGLADRRELAHSAVPVCSATIPPAKQPVAHVAEARARAAARPARPGPESAARSRAGTCRPSRRAAPCPSSGTSRSNQSGRTAAAARAAA